MGISSEKKFYLCGIEKEISKDFDNALDKNNFSQSHL